METFFLTPTIARLERNQTGFPTTVEHFAGGPGRILHLTRSDPDLRIRGERDCRLLPRGPAGRG